MKKILLTGNKGFIGSHLQSKLEELGYDVTGMDIKNSRGEDIRGELCVKAYFRKYRPEIVIHLAALTGVRKSVEEPIKYFRTNIEGTYNLLLNAQKQGCKRFLFASSSSVYGRRIPPLKEGMGCDHQLSPYAVSKKAGEMLCRMFGRLPTTVFRPFTVYGGELENMREDMVVYKLIEAGKNGTIFEKYGRGDSIRGYTHIEDLTDGIVKLLDYKPENNYGIFNLGGKERVRLNRLIRIVKKEFPKLKVKQVKMPEVDMMYNYADTSKARKLVGFSPKRSFIKEIKKLCCQ